MTCNHRNALNTVRRDSMFRFVFPVKADSTAEGAEEGLRKGAPRPFYSTPPQANRPDHARRQGVLEEPSRIREP